MDDAGGWYLVDPWSGFLRTSRFLIHDRSALFSESFRQVLRSARIKALRLPARSPNLNAYAERFVRTIRQECLDRIVFFGEASLLRTVEEFVTHYNRERNHQVLANKIIQPEALEFPCSGPIHFRKRLGGLLNYYYREATG
jgi:transposase InsO family protein